MTTTTPNQGYPLPAGPNKLQNDVLRLIAALTAIDADVAGLLSDLTGKANVGHGHAMADISGLVSALSNKLDLGYHDALANLTDVDVAGVANGMALLRQASKWIPVALQIGNIAGLETALNGKAAAGDIASAINALSAVSFTVQSLTAGQQGQARANIGGGILAGFRNKLINADFNIYQRSLDAGDVVIGGASNGYVHDRWRVHTTGGISCTASRLTTVGDIYRSYGRFVFSGGGAAGSNVRQRVEGVRTLAGKRVTVSGYIGSSVDQSVSIELTQFFGSGGSPSGAVVTSLGSVALVATGGPNTLFSLTVDLPSIAGKTMGTNLDDFLELAIINGAANGLTLYLTNISLVAGDATREANDLFEYRPAAVEVALCHRYYQRFRHVIDVLNYAGGYSDYQAGRLLAVMRTTPSASRVTISSVGGYASVEYAALGADSFYTYFSGGAGASGANTWTGFLIFDAEF